MMDITSRKESEEKIQEQAALIDKAHDAVLVRDMEDKILYWNKSAERLYGWTAAEALGQTASELLSEGPAQASREAAEQVTSRGDWTGELQHVTKDRRILVVASSWTLLRDRLQKPKCQAGD